MTSAATPTAGDAPVLYALQNGVARITLNRPDRLNAFNEAMHAALLDALRSANADESLRAVVLTGAGRGFCAGQDQSERKPLPPGEKRDLGETLARFYKPLILQLRAMRAPVICVLNGVAAGAGASLALACDIVIAAKSASLVQAFGKLGLLPDAGATWMLPHRLGTARALAWAMLGDKLSAEQAAQWGLIWRCVDDAALAQESEELIARLAASATRAVVATRNAILAATDHTLEEQIDVEIEAQRALGYTDDYLEGVAAFREKRAPRFNGR